MIVDATRPYVVVIFGSPSNECILNYEPMEAIGPVTWNESTRIMERYKDWQPHRLIVRTEDV